MTGLINDSTISVLQQALDGLSQRQSMIGHNIANAETPGYQALGVTFEQALQKSVNGPKLDMATTSAGHLAAPASVSHGPVITPRQNSTFRLDGNNVDIDLEMTQMAQTSIQYQSLTQLVSKKLALLKTIASGR